MIEEFLEEFVAHCSKEKAMEKLLKITSMYYRMWVDDNEENN